MDVPEAWMEPEYRQGLEDRHSVGAPAPVALRVPLAAMLADEEIVTMSCHGQYEGDGSTWECLTFTRTRLLQLTVRREVDHWNYYSDSAQDADANEPPPVIVGTSRFLRDVRRFSLEGPSVVRSWDRFVQNPRWRWATGVRISFGDHDDVITPLPSGSPNDDADDEHVATVLALLAVGGAAGS